jgi:unsaturated chondroitin disaccharide hydrolase
VSQMCDHRARALELIVDRIDKTAAAAPTAGFPHYADPGTGVWTRTPAGDWTGGFWVGELWLAARVTGDERYAKLGRDWAQALRPRAKSETVFRGFLFWYGAALGAVLYDDEIAAEIAVAGGLALARLFNRSANVIPLGSEAEEASDVGRGEANIDGIPGGTPLLIFAARRAGQPELAELARANARRHIELCVRPDNSVCQSASFDPRSGEVLRRYTHKGARDDSTWTRAQAWAMLGFSQAACAGADEFLDVAVGVSDWWCEHLPKAGVASWDFDDPDGPPDTSGTAIAAASLLKLSAVAGTRSVVYGQTAEGMVDALIEHHLTGVDAADTRPAGILTDGCYNRRIGLATANELIWGDYFLLEALSVMEGHLNSEEV